MTFLDPRTDIAFKKLFGDMNHRRVLISFLNSVLNRVEGNKIVDVQVNDPHNAKETIEAKLSIVDVRCTDQQGSQYIVEMQVNTQTYYGARAQYYSSIALARQLKNRQDYENLVPVIFIGILDFNHIESANYVSHHRILNIETQICSLRHLEFYFIELKKFNKELEEISTILDKWIYFLKNAADLERIPASLSEPELKEAFDILEQSQWSTAELEAQERCLDAIRSQADQIKTARIEGKEEGREEGREEKAIEIALQLLDVLDAATIAKKTGLTIDQVEQLKKNGELR
jgi:predicted transposase/invertase (TIGR01784 family)